MNGLKGRSASKRIEQLHHQRFVLIANGNFNVTHFDVVLGVCADVLGVDDVGTVHPQEIGPQQLLHRGQAGFDDVRTLLQVDLHVILEALNVGDRVKRNFDLFSVRTDKNVFG